MPFAVFDTKVSSARKQMYDRSVSIFDSDAFNERLFVLRDDASPPPPGARDRMIDVDGARLHVRVHEPPPGRGTLLLFHGNGEVVADYDRAAAQFARVGVGLAVMDYRGYGQSTGLPSLRTVISDARVVAEAVRPQLVMGRSLGGLAAHELYARPVPGLEGIVLESALFDLKGLIRRRGLEPPERFSDDERAMFEPATKLALGRLPLLVLHGERDDLIAQSEAMSALATAGSSAGDKALVIVPRRGHNDVSLEDSYWSALAGFVAQVPPSRS
jgi:alpha-beta hydrolase superfamily lysophospholipase